MLVLGTFTKTPHIFAVQRLLPNVKTGSSVYANGANALTLQDLQFCKNQKHFGDLFIY